MVMMMMVSALPALAVNTGDANQGPPVGSGGYGLTPTAEEKAPKAQNDNAATVFHCGGMDENREGAVVIEDGTDGTPLGSSECQEPPRNENGSPTGHL